MRGFIATLMRGLMRPFSAARRGKPRVVRSEEAPMASVTYYTTNHGKKRRIREK